MTLTLLTGLGQPAEAATALYAPYPSGTSYRVSQGMNGPYGHGSSTYGRYAVDFATGNGKSVSASAPGTVVRALTGCANTSALSGCNGGLGNYVDIKHSDGRCTRYAHLSRVDVSKDSKVKQAQRIGLTGTSGRSSSAHLHFLVTSCDSYSKSFKLVEYSGSYAHSNLHNRYIKSKNGQASRQTVTDDDATLYGASQWWHHVTHSRGVNGDYDWTLSAGNKYSNDTVWGEWKRSLAGGRYEVQCWIPNRLDAVAYARYRIHHKGGVTTKRIRQADYTGGSGAWAKLGTYDIGTTGQIRLGDHTGVSSDYNKRQAYDACRWIPR